MARSQGEQIQVLILKVDDISSIFLRSGFAVNAANKRVMETISPAQQQKINETMRANTERFLQSGLFRAMQRDVEMFGHDAFSSFADAQKDDG